MKLSLIIATYNRSASLMRTLRSVVEQTAPRSEWECIVVNNNSKDSTEADFECFVLAHPEYNLKMVNESAQGLSNARNCGIDLALGDVIAIIDDDETIVPEYIASYIEFFEKHKALAAGGRVIPVYENCKPKWISRYTEQLIANPIYLGGKVCRFPKNRVPAGGNMAFRREVFERCGRFNPTLGRNGESLTGGEENELFRRIRNLGEQLFYVPKAAIYHHIPDEKLSAERFERLCFDVGRSKYLRAAIIGKEEALLKDEKRKKIFTNILALYYTATLRSPKGKWLVAMRHGIGCGIDAEHTKHKK